MNRGSKTGSVDTARAADKFRDALFLWFAQIKTNVFAEIGAAQLDVELIVVGDDLVEVRLAIALDPQQLLAKRRIAAVATNRPHRKNKRQAGHVLPRLTKIEDFMLMRLPQKLDARITDQQYGILPRRPSVVPERLKPRRQAVMRKDNL